MTVRISPLLIALALSFACEARADVEVGLGEFICVNQIQFAVPAMVSKDVYESIKAVAPITDQVIANFLAWVRPAEFGGRTGVEAAEEYCRAWGSQLATSIRYLP